MLPLSYSGFAFRVQRLSSGATTLRHCAPWFGRSPQLLARPLSTDQQGRGMANRAEDARARVEARFRKQYEAERTAGTVKAERKPQPPRARETGTTEGPSAGQGGRRKGDWT